IGGHPVRARRDTRAYRAGKFIRRHRLGVAAAAAIAVALVGGIAATTWQARVAQRERTRAERRYADVRAMANTLICDADDAIADLPGATAARKLLLERGAAYLDSLADDGADPTLRIELAAAYGRLGDVQGHRGRAYLGDFTGARKSYQKRLAILDGLLATDPRNAKVRIEHAKAVERLADMREVIDGDFAGAVAGYRLALADTDGVLAAHPDNVDARGESANIIGSIGQTLMAMK